MEQAEQLEQQKLNKEAFDKLPIEEQLKIVNDNYEAGVSLRKFAENMGVTESKIRKRFNRIGYFREKESGLYKFKEGFVIPEKKPVAPKKVKPKNKTKTVTTDDDVLNKLSDLEKEIELLKLEFKIFKKGIDTNGQKDNSKALESHLKDSTQCPSEASGLNIRGFNGELKQISYRYHAEVLEAFEKVTELYPHYTKQKILNTLLMEALEKYLK